MVIVFSVILFVLGLLGAESLINLKVPAFRSFMASLMKYQEVYGILGIVFGIIYFVYVLDMLPLLRFAPGHFLIAAASVVTMIALGLIFGLEAIRRNLKDTNSALFLKLENFRIFSLRFQKNFGIAGVVLGLLTFFSYI